MRYLSFLIFLLSYSAHSNSNFSYISLKKESCLEYTIQVHYILNGSGHLTPPAEINFGDGIIETFDPYSNPNTIINDCFIYTHMVKHAYPGAGDYIVSFRIFNRVVNIENISHSVNTPVYTETHFVIDSYLGCNNTPEIENFPLYISSVAGETYKQDFSISDPEGDSVSFEYVIPKQDNNIIAEDYRLPFQHNISENQDISQLAFDQNQCSVMFNTQKESGRYCFDFRIIEWRKKDNVWYEMSSTMVDFNIDLISTNNHNPVVAGIKDTVIIAGNVFESNITVTDSENDSIQLNSYADFLHLIDADKTPEYKYYPGPVQKTIQYTPSADAVREKPYKAVFSAIDSRFFGKNESMYVWITDKAHTPEPVSVFTGQALSDNQINVYWQDTDDELGYIIERSDKFFPQFERLAVLPSNAALYEDSSVVIGNTYQYRITAVGTTMSDYTLTEVSTREIITALPPFGYTESLVISPNPSHGVFRISNASGIQFMEILDISGRKVWAWQKSFTCNTTTGMEIYPNLSHGAYILNLVSGSKAHTEKIVLD
jgi:hypothetical protein